MRVFLESIGSLEPWHDQHVLLSELAAKDDVGQHLLVHDRQKADVILTVFNQDPRFSKLVHDPRRFGLGTYDLGFPVLPGLYPSLPSWNAHPQFARSCPYLPRPWESGDTQPYRESRTYLFSFVGSRLTSSVRNSVLGLRHDRCFLRDTAGDVAYESRQAPETYRRFRAEYREVLTKSSFVLCPRGVGASSFRLFETMRAGRVPVVISDAWVPPLGLPWEEFSIRIPEGEVDSIPAVLESREKDAVNMGLQALECWNRNFSESTVFNWLVDQICEMQISDSGRFQNWKFFKLLAPRNIRSVTLPMVKHRIWRR